MTPLMFGRVLLIAACQALAASAGLAQQDAPALPPAAGMSAAQELIMAGKHEEALTLLRPLAAGRPAGLDVLFHLGMAAAATAQRPGVAGSARDALLDEAADAFRAMLVQRPGLVRARLELARVLFLKEEDGLAKEHFERALAGNPPPQVAANINRFLAEIRARRRWSAYVGFALEPDSNINTSTDARRVYLRGIGEAEFTNHDPPSSGVGLSAWIGGEYQHPLGEELRLRFGGEISRTEFSDSEFNRMTVSGHAGPRWLIDRDTEGSLLAVANRRWMAGDPNRLDLGLRIELKRRLNHRLALSLQTSRLERRHDVSTRLDGPVLDASLGLDYVLTPALRANAGLGWSRERPESETSRNTGRRLEAGLSASLQRGLTIGGTASLRWTDWEGNQIYQESFGLLAEEGLDRKDRTSSLRLSVHHRAFTVSGFSPQFSLTGERRTSNIQTRDYDRVFGELRFVRPF